MSSFQIIVLGIFSTLILVGVGVFAAFGGAFSGGGAGKVVVWGTEERVVVQGVLDTLRLEDKALESVSYEQKSVATYAEELVNAMASGVGPDLFLVSDDQLQTFSDKILIVPYSAVSQGSYFASFVDNAQIFLTPQGTYAMPFSLDPLVMYWNRDLFASAGVGTPPTKWNDFLTLAPKITSLSQNTSPYKSAVALGEWRNIPAAKEILAALFMQAGDSIVARGAAGVPAVVLGTALGTGGTSPAESALRFYTEFGNPSKTTYSWNRSLPQAQDAFVAGDLGVYFGFASEYTRIAERNPNLRFAVESIPQVGGTSRITFGRITGLAISRSAQNVEGALAVAQRLSSQESVALVSGALQLPPVRRDVAVDTSGSAVASVFVDSALIARSWLDPEPVASDGIFQAMIESVVSGRNTPASAVAEAAQALRELLPEPL